MNYACPTVAQALLQCEGGGMFVAYPLRIEMTMSTF